MSKGMKVIIGRSPNDTQIIVNGEKRRFQTWRRAALG